MESIPEKSHFDSLLGGDVEIPQSVSFKPFIKARMDEIEALTQLIETPSNNVLLKHQFPKHMRRRAMSQNVKRIPKRLREHQIDMREKSGVREVPIKRPRRKYRRRPQNLLDEYNRRQRKLVWLETHIWHAKRFHMVEKWGYKLPNFPNDKSYRACYRATSKHCLIQDISYYCCIELSGLLNEICDGLEKHSSNNCGSSFNAKHIQSGSSEGTSIFFGSGKYPYGAIGEIHYTWRPDLTPPDINILWMWCHPGFYQEVVEELIKTFALEIEQTEKNKDLEYMDEDIVEPMEHNGNKVMQTSVEDAKLKTRNVPYIKTPKYKSNKNSVKMILLKDTLNRFRLTGPLSQALITSTFKEIDLSKRTVNDWCCDYKIKNEINKQLQFWQKMKNITHPGQLPPNLVLGLIAVDPRFTMPAHRNKTEGTSVSDFSAQSIQSIEKGLSYSPIWSNKVRDEVTQKKLSTHQLNELRSNKLVPGIEVELNNDNINNFPAIPCMFLQRPGTNTEGKPLGYSSGWDIVVPAGYGQPVWLALIMHGGRPGGLKETTSLLREAGKVYLPPDTTASKLEEAVMKDEQYDTYFRLPPAKRQNYVKLGFPSPFHCPWNVLIKDWSDGEHESFFVLRNRTKLFSLRNILKKSADKFNFEEIDKTSLVGVTITLIGKGSLGNNAYICIPSQVDLKKLKEDSNFRGPVEPQHRDDLEDKRTLLSELHQKKMRKLARARNRQRKKGLEIDDDLKPEFRIRDHALEMKMLWLPHCTTVKDIGCRTVIGFITSGDFSFINAKSCGVGYICLKGLLDFLQVEQFEKKRYVLVRNSNTNQYRFAYINIIC